MLTIIHGDDTAASRKYFLETKQATKEPILLDGDKMTLTELTQIFEGGGLFSDSKSVFIEQFINKKKKSDEFKSIAEYLLKNATENTIILWEGKELEKSSLTPFKSATIKPFKLPQTLFAFLDNIKPGNGKQLVALFHKTIATTEEEMVFFMLIRQIRLLLNLSGNNQPTEEIDELKRMAPWQKGKLHTQAKLFTNEQLITIYNTLFHIESGQKTGNLNTSLTSAIDFLLIGI